MRFLNLIPANSADIVFLDPPFNLGKRYSRGRDVSDLKPEREYTQWLHTIVHESANKVAPGGVLYIYHLPQWAMRVGAALEATLTFRHWIAVSMKNGFVRGDKLYPAHYALLMFTNGTPTRFRRPKLKPAVCRHCGEYVKDYGGYKSIIEERGINLSDFWDDISPVRHAKRKYRVANELPRAIFDRIIEVSGSTDGLYVDPFVGSGGGVVAAASSGMRFAACDIVRSNCTLVADRLDQLAACEDGQALEE